MELPLVRRGDTYEWQSDNESRWRVTLAFRNAEASPLREEALWAGRLAIGGGADVFFLAADSGAVVHRLSLDGDLFGHLAPTDDVLYVLGFQRVVAIDATLAVRWRSEPIAVDGIVWRGCVGDRLLVSAEMDPPGGWVDVVLDAATGRVHR